MRNWTGRKLKSVREQQGLSRETLSRRIGMSRDAQSIRLLEEGKIHPTFETLLELADALEVPVTLIYEGKAFG